MTEIITLVILILSIVLHEVAHGYAANWLGDPTARLAGRLSPNPLLHIDPLGSVLLPGLLYLSGASFLFGWAKPVPYNPYNLRNQRWGESFVAAAGPLTNLFLAGIFAVLIRFSPAFNFSEPFMRMIGYIVFINILLALFNAIPIPPLDGSKVIAPFLPFGLAQRYRAFTVYMESLGFIALILFIFIFIQFLSAPFLSVIVQTGSFFTGLSPFDFLGLISR
jgi:Zn-dependent protease